MPIQHKPLFFITFITFLIIMRNLQQSGTCPFVHAIEKVKDSVNVTPSAPYVKYHLGEIQVDTYRMFCGSDTELIAKGLGIGTMAVECFEYQGRYFISGSNTQPYPRDPRDSLIIETNDLSLVAKADPYNYRCSLPPVPSHRTMYDHITQAIKRMTMTSEIKSLLPQDSMKVHQSKVWVGPYRLSASPSSSIKVESPSGIKEERCVQYDKRFFYILSPQFHERQLQPALVETNSKSLIGKGCTGFITSLPALSFLQMTIFRISTFINDLSQKFKNE
jgi:hypothetical protein